MAYSKKYIFSAVSKSGLTYTAELWENDYTGPQYNVNTGSSPFTLNCQGSGDDPFQPILPTIFTIRADFSDFTGPYPDLVSTDDRKYYVRVTANADTYFVWQGFVLMDSISIPFTTGRNFVDIVCVDGLALLKSVPYVFTSDSVNTSESLLQIIRNCLSKIGYPITFYINSAINYYATAHNPANSYIRYTNLFPAIWTNDDFTFKSCYDVLEDICISHAVQLFQSGGEWWITSVNERASDTLRVFRTDDTSGIDTLIYLPLNRTIQPYQNDTSTPYYFIDNSQTKIIKKGYNYIEVVNELNYPKNNVYNGNMLLLTGGVPTGWQFTNIGSSGNLTMVTDSNIYGARITAATTRSTLQGMAGYASEGDIITFEFQAKCSSINDLKIYISLDASATLYRYTNVGGNQWNTGNNPYNQPISSTNLQTFSITTLPAPANGTIDISFEATYSGPGIVFVANVKKTATSVYAKKQVYYNQTASNQYKKSITIPIGGQFPLTNNTQIQSILSQSNNSLVQFSRFSGGPNYSTLATLIYSQLFNIYAKPNINIQFTQYNLFTGTGILGLIQNFGITDPTSVINVNNKRFVLSQCIFDYINNTLSGTALEVSNTNLSYTLLTSIPTAPPTLCYLWVNVSSSTNWVGNYTNCAGVVQNNVTLTPGQSICAKGTPTKISGPDLLQGSQC